MKRGVIVQLRPDASIEDLSDEGLVAACATGVRDRRARGARAVVRAPRPRRAFIASFPESSHVDAARRVLLRLSR